MANRFPGVLRSDDKPRDNAERLAVAQIAFVRMYFVAATRNWADALGSQPKLGDDRRALHRYNAARAAALAGAGQAKDEPPPDDAAKARLRQQALEWLKAELTAWSKTLDSGEPPHAPEIARILGHWEQDAALAALREADALTTIPEDEQTAWRSFWADLESLRKRAASQSSGVSTQVGTAAAQVQNLGVGDPAPKLEVKSFVKGEPIATLEPGKIYVVEFWATWCAPCRVSIPHLTELQKKYRDVVFIGVSILEQDQNAVKPFVDAMGDRMSYRVAIDAILDNGDTNDGRMATNWMKAAGQDGIPTAFIIDKGGRVAWIGNPMSIDEPLEKIVGGSWDLTTARSRSRKESENPETAELVAALAGLRNEIQLRPDDGGLYSNYGRLLGYLGRHDEAIAACRKAIHLNNNDGGAHYNLGNSLAAQGQLRDALAAFGDARRLDPSLSQSRQWQLLYHAACAAAKAATGKGKDEPPPDDAAKVKLRRQALDSLRAEYKAWSQLLESGEPEARRSIAAAMQHWKKDSDLAGIRDDEALARLPDAERKEWQALWADVDSRLGPATTPIPTETKTRRTEPLRQDDVKADSLQVLESLHRRAHQLAPGAPSEAEPLFRQALEGYRKAEGPDGDMTLDLTLDLANLMYQSGRGPDAEPLLRAALEPFRRRFGLADPRTAGILAPLGLSLIQQAKWAEAEPILRECLAIREKSQPDEWNTFNTRSLLGGSLLGQKKYADAEPLIVSGYEGMKAREAKIPQPGKPRFTEAAERVVRLYEEWGKKEKAAEWRTKLAKPSSEPPPKS
jgi:tetratricopeptide (TPR) repeat protein